LLATSRLTRSTPRISKRSERTIAAPLLAGFLVLLVFDRKASWART
jgi:hypothetical protein